MAARLGTHLPGPSADSLLHYWNGWWVKRALLTGTFPYHCDVLFHPHGVSLATHNLAWFHILLWLPLQALFGGLTGYNLTLLGQLAACGLSAYALALQVTRDRFAALVAGLIYLAWPFRISQLDHPNLVGTMLVPLLLLCLRRLVRHQRARDGIWVGLCAAGAGIARWQVLIPAGLLAAIWLACQGCQATNARVIRGLALAALVAALILAPFGLMLLRAQTEAPAELVREESVMQTDLLAFVTPPAGHPLLDELTASLYDRYYAARTQHRRFPMYVGLSVLALSALGVATRRRKVLPWLVSALVLAALALGSSLRVGGDEIVGIPTLYGLLEPLRLFRLMREPDRYGLFVALPMAMLAGHGLSWLTERRWLAGRRAAMAAVLVSAIVIGEYLQVPVPTMHPLLSPYYDALSADEQAGTVLNLPLDAMQAKWYMFAQTTHERPIVLGNLSRLPADAYAYVQRDPWLAEIAAHDEMPPWQTSITKALGRLRADGVTHLILHRNRVGADRIAHWQRYLAMQPLYEDELLVAYTTDPQANEHYAVVPLWDGLGPVGVRVSTDCQRPGGLVAVDVVWGTETAVAPLPDVRIALQSDSGVGADAAFPLLPDGDTGGLPADALNWASYMFRLPDDLPDGGYGLVLDLGDAELTAAAPCWGEIQVASEGCEANLGDGLVPVSALFGERMRLLGYGLDASQGALNVRLLWRAEQRMKTDYTVFVHLYDPADGVPVAQDDAMPRRGAFPTRFWMSGETVEDVVSIPLEGVRQGTYGVLVGVYNGATGERLALQVGGGPADRDGRLVLADAWEVP